MITKEEILSSPVRALTWKEPFTSAMLDVKLNETRTRPTNVRGLVLICSGLSYYKNDQLLEICGSLQMERLSKALKRSFYSAYLKTGGYAIAIGRLVDCWPMKEKDETDAYVMCKAGLFVHRYTDVTPIEPFRWQGTQGWTLLNDEQKNRIQLCTI